MKKQEELAVITKTYDLILWSCNHTGRNDWIEPYVVMTPGAIDGREEVTCPNCNELLTVDVNDIR